MHLDVVVPTYNRSVRVCRTIQSLLDASVPDGHTVQILVVENNCRDDTSLRVGALATQHPGRLHLLREGSQGVSHARNAGIRAATGDLVGFIDDDERVVPNWVETAFAAFSSRPELSFIGGPYLPSWEAPAPEWLPASYPSAIGIKLGAPDDTPFGDPAAGMLMGGNAVVRRSVFELVGVFDVTLGRTDKGLLSSEDDDFYGRLMAAGLSGLFLPRLAIYHDIPAGRLTKDYHRRWCFGRGVSLGYRMRTLPPTEPLLLGLPRWQVRKAAAGVGRRLLGIVGVVKAAEAFDAELAVWDLMGIAYGRYLWRPHAR